ncbi:hypothetical protein DPMN_191024 [Dreissena polymorpha]|uniref:FERM domain-containing protein n=1 Tax=Dreissena polymorpha TaxID=45954 RepID=A0A9D4BE74_DREPO|nr:hypothetical protein DPMN_191024 [Dreissena polymorpha]
MNSSKKMSQEIAIANSDVVSQILLIAQETVSLQIDLPEDFVNYFGLYLVCKEANDGEMTIVRKLQDFMSPYISRKTATKQGVHEIVLRKSYWDSSFDDELLSNKVTMNLLYVQAVNDI